LRWIKTRDLRKNVTEDGETAKSAIRRRQCQERTIAMLRAAEYHGEQREP
jgi:flagellar biosynthesis regulator FlaF